MAYEVRHFPVTVPAGTPLAAPQTTDVSFPVRDVIGVSYHLPPGCAGLVGFYLAMGGVSVLPSAGPQFVIGDGSRGHWDLHDKPDSGAWQVIAYNTGANPHTIQIDFHLDLVERQPTLLDVLDEALLSHYSAQLAAWHD